MDLRQYFRKLREVEASIAGEYVLVKSVGTGDGGKAGVISEVSRQTAAQLIVEGRATLADENELSEFRSSQRLAREAFEKANLAKQIQIAILSDPAFQATAGTRKSPTNPGK